MNDGTDFGNVWIGPSSFNPEEKHITVVTRPFDSWPSAERALRAFDSRVVMARLPFFWQLHAPLHAACRKARAVLYTNALNNAPLGLAAIREISADTVVSGAKAAELFAYEAKDAKLLDKLSWLLIHDVKDQWSLPELLQKESRRVAQEVHVTPGVVILEQCEQLIREHSALFHATHALSTQKTLSFELKTAGTCDCGKEMVERSA